MEIKKKNKKLTVILGSQNTILEIEQDTNKIKNSIENIQNIQNISKIEINANLVKDIDTAYIQLILALKATASQKKISFDITEISEEFRNILNLYNLNF